MTTSTQESSGRGENIDGVRNVWITTDGSDDSSPPATPNHANATYVRPPIDDSKSNMTTSEPPSTRSHRFVDMPVTPATYDNDDLASLLIEGWQRGWLKVARPKCRHHPYKT